MTGIRLSETTTEAIRLLDAVLVGRFEGGRFRRGVSTYPSIGSPVSPASIAELETIFAPQSEFTITIGQAVVAPDLPVRLDANILLARHCAVLGATGTGKSCTVTAILDGLFELGIDSPHIVIFDSNGEYAEAFRPGGARSKKANAVVLGPQLGTDGGLFLPHWFMDNEDHLGLLRAGEGAQAPLLQRAVADARLAQGSGDALMEILSLATWIHDVRNTLATSPGRKPQAVLAIAVRELEQNATAIQSRHAMAGEGDEVERWTKVASIAGKWKALGLKVGEKEGWDEPPTLAQRSGLQAILGELETEVRETIDKAGLGSATAGADFDAPRYYSLQELHDYFLPRRVGMAAEDDYRIRGYASTLFVRLSRLLADSRYDFMTRVPKFARALEFYLRLLLGTEPLADGAKDVPWSAAYRARSQGERGHAVTILDLSMVAHDVLGNATAVLARLLFGFAQRVQPRGSFPMLLVLEEAHRYIPESDRDRQMRSTVAFERIAKEGRKYGVSLLVASQRPREVSSTVLAQCGTLIAHRLGTEEDQDYLRSCAPFAGRDIMRQLPDLAVQHALVLGEAAPLPTPVIVREVKDPPLSKDPDFITAWRKPRRDAGQVIADVAASWEAGGITPERPAQE